MSKNEDDFNSVAKGWLVLNTEDWPGFWKVVIMIMFFGWVKCGYTNCGIKEVMI